MPRVGNNDRPTEISGASKRHDAHCPDDVPVKRPIDAKEYTPVACAVD